MKNTQPPTSTESMLYIVEKKLDAVLARLDRVEVHITASNARDEAPPPLPTRRSSLALWVLLWVLAAFFSGAVYRASAQSTRMGVCVEALVENVDSSKMGRTTATRTARSICQRIERLDPQFFRALR